MSFTNSTFGTNFAVKPARYDQQIKFDDKLVQAIISDENRKYIQNLEQFKKYITPYSIDGHIFEFLIEFLPKYSGGDLNKQLKRANNLIIERIETRQQRLFRNMQQRKEAGLKDRNGAVLMKPKRDALEAKVRHNNPNMTEFEIDVLFNKHSGGGHNPAYVKTFQSSITSCPQNPNVFHEHRNVQSVDDIDRLRSQYTTLSNIGFRGEVTANDDVTLAYNTYIPTNISGKRVKRKNDAYGRDNIIGGDQGYKLSSRPLSTYY